MTSDWEKGPVISDADEVLMRRVSVTRLNGERSKSTWEVFTQRLRWQICAECHLVLRHKGVTVKEMATLVDTNGVYLSAITNAFEDIETLCDAYRVDTTSELTMDLDTEVVVRPGVPMPEAEIVREMDRYKVYRPPLDDMWFRHDVHRMAQLMVPMGEQEVYEANLALDDDSVAPRTVIERGLLWSSKGQASLAVMPQALQAWMAAERGRIEALAEATDTSAWDLMVAIA